MPHPQSTVGTERASLISEVHYSITIVGVSPLVMNSNSALLLGENKGRDPAAWEREHFREKCYLDADSLGLVIPARALAKAFVEACSFMPKKPKGVGFKSYARFIEAATIVPTDAVLDKTVDDVLPLTLVVNLDPSKGNKGPRGPRTRPMLAVPWSATAELIVFDPILTEDVLQEIVERAGKQVGLLDGRRINFGRCLMTLARME